MTFQASRKVVAPPQSVFAAFEDSARLAVWWGPTGFTTPEIELALHVGGAYRFGMQPPDAEVFHLAGEFLDVEPPSRLAYTFRWEEPDPDDRETVVRLSLDAAAELTRLSLWHGTFATEARLALHTNGWTDALQSLGDLLGSGA